MDIELLSKMVKELILDRDEVALPGVGSFVAEMVPAYFSDKGYTINPPYKRLSFRHKDSSQDTSLIDLYASGNKIDKETATRIVSDFLRELKKNLETRKSIALPGLGKLRATRENHFFFIADEDLDIYPEGFGLEPISLKTHQESEEEVSESIRKLSEILGTEQDGEEAAGGTSETSVGTGSSEEASAVADAGTGLAAGKVDGPVAEQSDGIAPEVAVAAAVAASEAGQSPEGTESAGRSTDTENSAETGEAGNSGNETFSGGASDMESGNTPETIATSKDAGGIVENTDDGAAENSAEGFDEGQADIAAGNTVEDAADGAVPEDTADGAEEKPTDEDAEGNANGTANSPANEGTDEIADESTESQANKDAEGNANRMADSPANVGTDGIADGATESQANKDAEGNANRMADSHVDEDADVIANGNSDGATEDVAENASEGAADKAADENADGNTVETAPGDAVKIPDDAANGSSPDTGCRSGNGNTAATEASVVASAEKISNGRENLQPYERKKSGLNKSLKLCFEILVIIAVIAIVAFAAFLILAQTAPNFIDSILYSPEELEIIRYKL